jgi:hypothetical protein
MFGLLHSLKSFVTRLNPVQQLSSSASSDAVEVSEPLQSYTTGGYKLHYFESLTGLRFVLTTDPAVDSAQVFFNASVIGFDFSASFLLIFFCSSAF